LTTLCAKLFSRRTVEGRGDIRKVWTTVVVKDSCIEIRFGSTIVEDLDAEGRRREKEKSEQEIHSRGNSMGDFRLAPSRFSTLAEEFMEEIKMVGDQPPSQI